MTIKKVKGNSSNKINQMCRFIMTLYVGNLKRKMEEKTDLE